MVIKEKHRDRNMAGVRECERLHRSPNGLSVGRSGGRGVELAR